MIQKVTYQIKYFALVLAMILGHYNTVLAATEQSKTLPTTTITYSFTSELTQNKFEDLPLLKSRTLISADQKTELKMVNYGLRKKAVFGLVPVRVYTLQFLAAHPDQLVKTPDGILNSLKAGSPVQLYLTMLRNIPGKKISDSFRESLEVNKINVKHLSPELKEVLEVIDSIPEFKDKQSFSLTAVWQKEKEQGTLIIEDATSGIKSISGNSEFLNQFFSIWFGKTTDSRLEDLKNKLIN